ncbi:Outer membrane cobalamin receptor protein [Spirosomataceae bacterium TFI 002]|nr:Outer membrane cobalamin receptor protein [Spirosomataceae bacterium TFI 002]
MFYKTLILLLLPFAFVFAQENINGKVNSSEGEELVGAVVKWAKAPASATFTNVDGTFTIPKNKTQNMLIVSSVGFKTDTFHITETTNINLILKSANNELDAVVVKSSAVALDLLSPIQTEIITTKALEKAACCNLSESFETNASVSVSITDAVTGAKQLQMLGLSGKYIQTNIESVPSVRGLASTYGLTYTPGTWISSIDLGKGIGSVVNGYESITGNINVEIHKPDNADLVYINTYVNSLGRGELNANFAKKLNDKWSVGLLSHGSGLATEIDKNGDSFRDTPKYSQINVLNRWKYSGDRFMGQFGFRVLSDKRSGGQVDYDKKNPNASLYGFTNDTERYEFFSKIGVLFPKTPYRGMALVTQGVLHNSESLFGKNPYLAKEKSFYSNLIYQDIFGNTQHSYKTGLSLLVDDYDESFQTFAPKRTEIVPGGFFEYTFNQNDRTIAVVGLRQDFNSVFGNYFTPRFHLKQSVGNNTTWRLSAGKGFRAPNVFVESFGYLVSSREVKMIGELKMDEAWNFGSSVTYEFGKSALILDAYHTEFQQQQVYDVLKPGELLIYNSSDRSYATSLQAEIKLAPSEQWDINLAYRYLDNKVTFQTLEGQNALIQKPFTSKNRWHFNTGYALPYDKWKFDLTVQYNGPQSVPVTSQMGSENLNTVKGFFNVNTQINRNFRLWSYYVGAENLLNFKQENPILGANDPFGSTFDAGMNWGPIVGRIIYFGTRFKIQ